MNLNSLILSSAILLNNGPIPSYSIDSPDVFVWDEGELSTGDAFLWIDNEMHLDFTFDSFHNLIVDFSMNNGFQDTFTLKPLDIEFFLYHWNTGSPLNDSDFAITMEHSSDTTMEFKISAFSYGMPSISFDNSIVYEFDLSDLSDYIFEFNYTRLLDNDDLMSWIHDTYFELPPISNNTSVSDNVFDIVGQTVSSYVSSITTMFNELMLLFYADNKLTYLSQLLLLGFGIGITKWGMNFFKDSVRL